MSKQANETEEEYDVVICGGGPTGLIMALGLAGFSLRVLLVNKEVDRAANTRTVVVWPRNIESIYLYSRELYNRFVEKSGTVNHLTLAFGSYRLLEVPLSGIGPLSKVADVPWYFFQREVEDILETYAIDNKGLDLTILKGWCLEDAKMSQESNNYTLHLNLKEVKAETKKQLRTRYLIGCDGPGSKVRTVSNIDLELFPKQSAGWIADAKLTYTKKRSGPDIMNKGVTGNALFVSTSTGVTGFFSLADDLTRVVLPVPMESVDSEKRADPTLEQFNAKLATLDTHYLFQIHDPQSITSYRFRFGLARSFVDQTCNIILAGDSAHFHSPVGGQGMNLGMQDAFNLSWKLVMSLKHPKVIDFHKLLRSYDQERRPLAESVVRRTYASTNYLYVNRFPIIWWLWAQIIWFAYKIAMPRALTLMSQLESNYSKSPLCSNNWHRAKWYYLWDFTGVAAGYHAPFTDVRTALGQKVFLLSLCHRQGFTLLYFPTLSTKVAASSSTTPLLTNTKSDDAWMSLSERFSSLPFSSIITKVLIVAPPPQGSLGADPSDLCVDFSYGKADSVEVQRVEDIDSRKKFVGDSTESSLYVIRPDFFVGHRSRPFNLQSLCDWFATFTVTA